MMEAGSDQHSTSWRLTTCMQRTQNHTMVNVIFGIRCGPGSAPGNQPTWVSEPTTQRDTCTENGNWEPVNTLFPRNSQ